MGINPLRIVLRFRSQQAATNTNVTETTRAKFIEPILSFVLQNTLDKTQTLTK